MDMIERSTDIYNPERENNRRSVFNRERRLASKSVEPEPERLSVDGDVDKEIRKSLDLGYGDDNRRVSRSAHKEREIKGVAEKALKSSHAISEKTIAETIRNNKKRNKAHSLTQEPDQTDDQYLTALIENEEDEQEDESVSSSSESTGDSEFSVESDEETSESSYIDDVFEDSAVKKPYKNLDFHHHVETLFMLADPEQRQYFPRKLEPVDIPHLNKFITENTKSYFGEVHLPKLFETSCFSIVLEDFYEDTSSLVASATFDDIPKDPLINMDGKIWRTNSQLLMITPMNSFFLNVFLYGGEFEPEACLAEVISSTFLACKTIDYIVIEIPLEAEEGYFFFSQLIREVKYKPKANNMKRLFIFERSVLFPQLNTREGRENDLDDVTSMLTKHEIATVIDKFGKSTLSGVISMSDHSSQSIVTEFEGSATGLLCVTTDINLETLNTFFQLEPYNGLHKPSADDQIYVIPAKSILDLKQKRQRVRDFFKESIVFQKEIWAEEEKRKDLQEQKDISKRYNDQYGECYPGEDGEIDDMEDMELPLDRPDSPDLDVVQIYKTEKEKGFEIITKEKEKDEHVKFGKDDENEEQIEDDRTSAAKTHSSESLASDSTYWSLDQTKFGKDPQMESFLLNRLKGIQDKLDSLNLSLDQAVLSDTCLQAVGFAEDMVNKSVIRYVHRSLINEKILPFEALHDPPYSHFNGLPNAIAIELCTMKAKYKIRMLDLIMGAFLGFPKRDYVIFTIPCGTRPPEWITYFTRVVPRKELSYNQELYVLNKRSFNCSLIVRKARKKDYRKIKELVATMYERDKIIRDFKKSFDNCYNYQGLQAFVLEERTLAEKPICGFAIVSNEEVPSYYQINYDLDNYLYYDLHDESEHLYLHHFIILPIFRHKNKIFLKNVMRLTKTNSVYQRLYPQMTENIKTKNQTLLNLMDVMIPLAPKARINYEFLDLVDTYDDERQPSKAEQDYRDPHAVIHLSKKFTFEPKIEINHRIVVVGASETGLAFLEGLICSAHLSFKQVTLVSPHGLPGTIPRDEIRDVMIPRKGGPSLSMTFDGEYYQRLGLQSWVNVVYGSCTKILRGKKLIVVNKTKIIHYDYLIITTGQQFTRPDAPNPEISNENFRHLKKLGDTYDVKSKIALEKTKIDEKEKEEKPPKKLVRDKPKPVNVFLLNTESDCFFALDFIRIYTKYVHDKRIIVHGACLEAYACISTLIKLGVEPKRILFITTSGRDMDWEKRHGYKDTRRVKDLMFKSMLSLGIHRLDGYNFDSWKLNKAGMVRKIFFQSEFEDPSIVSLKCMAYFPFVTRRVGDEIASAITEAFILYTDAIIIDPEFKTNDPSIYAAGTCTLYHRKLMSEQFNHYHCSSREIGFHLAAKIVKKIDPSLPFFKALIIPPFEPPFAPIFTNPIIRSSRLPGGWHYLHVGRPAIAITPCKEMCTCEMCTCGIELVTGSTNKMEDESQSFFRIWFNSYNRVESLECISKTQFSAYNMSCLYGNHESVLNKLFQRLEKSEVKNLYNFFNMPWYGAICCDRWKEFREELEEIYFNHNVTSNTKFVSIIQDYMENLENPDRFKLNGNILRRAFESSGLKKIVEQKFLDFLRYNRRTIPMFARPDFVENMIDERETSVFYDLRKPIKYTEDG